MAATWCWARPRRPTRSRSTSRSSMPQLKIYRRQGERTLFPSARYQDVPTPPLPPGRRFPRARRQRADRARSARRSAPGSRAEKFESAAARPAGRRGRGRPALRHPGDQQRGAPPAWHPQRGDRRGLRPPAAERAAAPLRAAIDAAFRGESRHRRGNAATEMADGRVRYLDSPATRRSSATARSRSIPCSSSSTT